MARKKLRDILIFIALVIFFTYIFYPKSLVKEVFISQSNTYLHQLGFPVEVSAQKLSVYWLTGIKLKDVTVISHQNAAPPAKIDVLTVRVAVLPALIGTLKIVSHLEIEQGDAELTVSLPLWKVIFGNNAELKQGSAEFHNFKIDGLAAHASSLLRSSGNSDFAALVPVIMKATLQGFLNGSAFYTDNKQTTSTVNLALKNAALDFNDQQLGLPKQTFSKAQVILSYRDPVLTIKSGSGIISQDISLVAAGDVKNIVSRAPTFVDLDLKVKLSGAVENNFGFLLPQLLSCPISLSKAGEMNVRLKGSAGKIGCY